MIFISCSVIAQMKTDSIDINLNISSKVMSSYKDMIANVYIKDYKKDSIKIPLHSHIYSSILNEFDTDFLFIVEKKGKKKYSSLKLTTFIGDHIFYIPGDYDYLKFGDSLYIQYDDWGNLYNYEKGQYRIRVIFKVSNLNNLKDVSSKWIYFTVIKRTGREEYLKDRLPM